MVSDRELRLRADIVRDQLDQTMKVTRRAIRASAELADDVRESRQIIRNQVAISAQHVRASRTVLGRGKVEG